MRVFSYYNSALKIISAYDGLIPLSHFLKNFFSKEKKYGSKDRKFIAQLCYSFYRTAFSLKDFSAEEKLKVSIFLCDNENEVWKDLFEEDWQETWFKSLHERISFIQKKYSGFNFENIFPYKDELSETVDIAGFQHSFLIKPKMFVRARKNNAEEIFKKLKIKNVRIEKISDTCLAFENNPNLDDVLVTDKEITVQDRSSQKVSDFFYLMNFGNNKIKVWDCCAASGGKSILVNDILKNIELTVSDKRSSILHNLQKRFHIAGIKNYESFIADLSKDNFYHSKKYELIICDAPCTGSGTWSRTPEQLFFFIKEMICEYAILQKKIIQNTIEYVAEEGYFLYVTCSVFKKENEDTVDFIEKNFPFLLIKKEVIKGYEIKADTMFAALFRKK